MCLLEAALWGHITRLMLCLQHVSLWQLSSQSLLSILRSMWWVLSLTNKRSTEQTANRQTNNSQCRCQCTDVRNMAARVLFRLKPHINQSTVWGNKWWKNEQKVDWALGDHEVIIKNRNLVWRLLSFAEQQPLCCRDPRDFSPVWFSHLCLGRVFLMACLSFFWGLSCCNYSDNVQSFSFSPKSSNTLENNKSFHLNIMTRLHA